MKISSRAQDQLPSHLKHLVSDMFLPELSNPDEISDHEPLLAGGLGLDANDAVELGLCIEEEFGVTIQTPGEAHEAFASIAALANYIQARTQPRLVPSRNAMIRRPAFQVLSSPSPG